MKTILALLLSLYLIPGTVTSICNNHASVTSFDGNVWLFVDDSLQIGDAVVMLMNDNQSSAVEDDIIVRVWIGLD